MISASGKSFNTVYANLFHFYEELDAVIQMEPLDFINSELRGSFAPIGIEKGKTFAPNERVKTILADAVSIGNAAARSTIWHPRENMTLRGIRGYLDQNWTVAFYKKNVFFNGEDGQTMNTDARVTFHYPYTAATPAMANPQSGSGSHYATAFVDADGQPFDGSKTFKVVLPADVPLNNFWSFTLYDSQTRSMLQTGQPLPAIDSIQNDPQTDKDGSIDIYFSPETPESQ